MTWLKPSNHTTFFKRCAEDDSTLPGHLGRFSSSLSASRDGTQRESEREPTHSHLDAHAKVSWLLHANMSWLLHAASAQWDQVVHFMTTPALRLPMLNIWVATFGGALHAPCTTFFLLELGLTPEQIGNGGMLMSFPDLFVAPLYGYALDRFGAFPVVCATAGCCAFGCLIRGAAMTVMHVYIGSAIIGLGAANLWVSVLSHLVQNTAPEKREACVSAFVFQVSILRILGKSAYFPCVYVLEQIGIDSLFMRYRIMMLTCPFFCVFGWISLVCCGGAVRRSRAAASDKAAATPAAAAASGSARDFVQLGFLVIAASVFIDAVARTSSSVVWPLIAKDKYGYGASEFAAPLFAESIASAATVFFAPTLSERLGGGARSSVALAVLCAALAALGAFSFRNALLVALLALLSAKDPSLRALGSLTLPPLLQGRAFAAMSAVRSLGDTLGNWAATRLLGGLAISAVANGPLLLAGVLLVAEAALLAAAFPLRRRGASTKARASPPVSPPAVELDAVVEDGGGLEHQQLQEKLALLPRGPSD